MHDCMRTCKLFIYLIYFLCVLFIIFFNFQIFLFSFSDGHLHAGLESCKADDPRNEEDPLRTVDLVGIGTFNIYQNAL